MISGMILLKGGIVGRFAANAVSAKILISTLGVYAILVGLRIFFIKPLPERKSKAHLAWLSPIGLGSGLLAGFISAGGKSFAVPAYNNAMGHHPQRAYAFASLGVVAASWAALATQFAFIAIPATSDLLLAVYEFALVTIVIAPILVIVGIRFLSLGL